MVHPSRFCQFLIKPTTATLEKYLVDLQSTTFQQVTGTATTRNFRACTLEQLDLNLKALQTVMFYLISILLYWEGGRGLYL